MPGINRHSIHFCWLNEESTGSSQRHSHGNKILFSAVRPPKIKKWSFIPSLGPIDRKELPGHFRWYHSYRSSQETAWPSWVSKMFVLFSTAMTLKKSCVSGERCCNAKDWKQVKCSTLGEQLKKQWLSLECYVSVQNCDGDVYMARCPRLTKSGRASPNPTVYMYTHRVWETVLSLGIFLSAFFFFFVYMCFRH